MAGRIAARCVPPARWRARLFAPRTARSPTSAVWPNLRFAATTLIVVVLVPSSKEPLVRPFDRVIEIMIGSLAGWLVSALFDSDRLRRLWPERIAPEAEERT